MPSPEPAPEISVVIPHLNHPKALDACLAALEAQGKDAPAFEAIVVDNGSADLPAEVIGRYPFARLAEEKTPGPGPARSHGARLARAPLVGFVDADCRVKTGWLKAITGHFAAHAACDVIGGKVGILQADPGRMTGIEAYESIWGYRMKLYVERDHYTASCNMAVRREVFLAVGDFAGIAIAEDVDWGRRAHAAGHRIDYVPAMEVATPARESFAELTRKWGRHIGHDYAALGPGLRPRLRWMLRALALAASPLAEIPAALFAPQVRGARARLLALACLTRIRLWRAGTMLGLLISGDAGRLSGAWRKQVPK